VYKHYNKLFEFFKKKRVLIISHDLSSTGAPRTLLGLAEILKEQNFFVAVYSTYAGPLKAEFERLGVSVFIFKRIWFRLLLPFLKIFNLVICNTILSFKIVSMFEKMHIKYFWWLHESGFLAPNIKDNPKILPILKKAKNVYAVSDFAKSYISEFNQDVKVLNFGIKDSASDSQNLNSDSSKITFCFPNAIIPIKGLDILLEAFFSLDDDYKNRCEIKLIGPIGDEEYFKKIQAHLLGVDNIIYVGEMPHKQVLEEMAKSNAIILPSRGDSYPTTIIEALMLDKIIIVSNKTGISSSIKNKENGFVFDINKPEELTKYLKMIIDNSEILKQNAAKNLFLEKFNFEIFKNQIAQVLNDMKI